MTKNYRHVCADGEHSIEVIHTEIDRLQYGRCRNNAGTEEHCWMRFQRFLFTVKVNNLTNSINVPAGTHTIRWETSQRTGKEVITSLDVWSPWEEMYD